MVFVGVLFIWCEQVELSFMRFAEYILYEHDP